MWMLGKKKKKIITRPGTIYAPIAGKYIPLAEIPDNIFAEGCLGKGCGIEPKKGEAAAPVNGVVSIVAETKHAIGITSEEGIELLLHVGMDTVALNGKGFSVLVETGENVAAGQPIMKFDIGQITELGYSVTTALVITNSDEYSEIHMNTGKVYDTAEEVGNVRI